MNSGAERGCLTASPGAASRRRRGPVRRPIREVSLTVLSNAACRVRQHTHREQQSHEQGDHQCQHPFRTRWGAVRAFGQGRSDGRSGTRPLLALVATVGGPSK